MSNEYEQLLKESAANIERIGDLTKQQAAMETLRAKRSLQFDPDEYEALKVDLAEAKAAQARVRRLLDIIRADAAKVEQRRRLAEEKELKAAAEQAVDNYVFAMSIAIDAACDAMAAIVAHRRLVGDINRQQAKIGAGPLDLPSPILPVVNFVEAFSLPDPRQAALKQLGGVPQTPARRPRPQPATVAQQPAPATVAFAQG